jgi:hypothetical protein
MLLTLIRHSKTKFDKNIPNVLWQLTDEGIELAGKLSLSEDIMNIDVVYSSLQTKALQTALILAKDNNIPIKTKPDLTELSSITNGIIKDYEGEVGKLYSGEIQRINHGETISEGKGRFNKAIDKIIRAENPDDRILDDKITDVGISSNEISGDEIPGGGITKGRKNIKNIGIVAHCNILSIFCSQFCEKTPHEIHGMMGMPDYAILDWETRKFIKFFTGK